MNYCIVQFESQWVKNLLTIFHGNEQSNLTGYKKENNGTGYILYTTIL